MRDVAIVSFAQGKSVRREVREEVEMLVPVIAEAVKRSGLSRSQIGFTVSGSSDYLIGRPFSFVGALDAAGPWPPIEESHVEMDGAFALYEAWVRLQHGDIDAAVVYCFGRSSLGDIREVLVAQLDPYLLGPLAPDAVSLAALQARAVLDSKKGTERDFAEIAARNRRNAADNPNAQVRKSAPAEELMREPYVVAPLRKHDLPPISDCAAAIVLAAGDLAKKVCPRPAWIRGIDTRIEPHSLGVRDLASSPSTKTAGETAGVGRAPVDVAELHAPYSFQEIILKEALGLDANVRVNPSGGALAANPVMVAGLLRIGEAAQQIHEGKARRAVAHATSGPCLQQNLVCVLEGGES